MPILQVLLKTRSVSATAHALGISQPAVSDALARLRATLEDQLLVRVGSRLIPTSYAECLMDPLDAICAELEAFLTKDTFDPKTAKRGFVIATSDLGGYLLARPILDMLIHEAPCASLQLVDIGTDLAARLSAREIDFALLPEFTLEDLAPAQLRFLALIETPRAALMRKGHPLTALQEVSLRDCLPFRHIGFQPDQTGRISTRLQMATIGVQLDFLARLGQGLLIPHLLGSTDYLSLLPKKFAEDMAGLLGLETRPMREPEPPMRIGLAWSPVQDRDPAHSWFRSTLAAYLAKSARAGGGGSGGSAAPELPYSVNK